jgi:hypothetical protein
MDLRDEKTSLKCVLHAGACIRSGCIFWEGGGAVLPGGCALKRVGVDVEGRDVDELVFELNRRLEQRRAEDDALRPRDAAGLTPDTLAPVE